jgi:hypothetical protein
MTQDIGHLRSGRPGNQNVPKHPFCSSALDSGDRVYSSRASPTRVKDNSLVLLRDSLLFLAKKYPAHARSISQIASSVDLLMRLQETRRLES